MIDNQKKAKHKTKICIQFIQNNVIMNKGSLMVPYSQPGFNISQRNLYKRTPMEYQTRV